MKMLKKLNPKTILGEVPRPTKENPQIPLYTLMGKADGIKQGETQYGIWTALTGSFLAVTADGEQFGAAVAFVHEPLCGMLAATVKDLEPGETVEFAARTGVAFDSTAATGYVYTVDLIREPDQSNPYEALLEHFQDALLPPPGKKAPKAA